MRKSIKEFSEELADLVVASKQESMMDADTLKSFIAQENQRYLSGSRDLLAAQVRGVLPAVRIAGIVVLALGALYILGATRPKVVVKNVPGPERIVYRDPENRGSATIGSTQGDGWAIVGEGLSVRDVSYEYETTTDRINRYQVNYRLSKGRVTAMFTIRTEGGVAEARWTETLDPAKGRLGVVDHPIPKEEASPLYTDMGDYRLTVDVVPAK